MIGQRIGPYDVIGRLGEGGMGEVYRARDPKLQREVAVKLLPSDVAGDPTRRARMLREARAAAALNHPNICTIYEVGEDAGRSFIAMEVVEGVPLSVVLAERSLPIDEMLRICVQLADAVALAHDRGIVHRDLKSANVMVTPGGRVKVLDFGLATHVAGDEGAEATRSAAPLTQPHEVVGTLPYMAPEQLRAQPADPRSDVWALGVILYEMSAGRRPFGGRSGFETSSAIMNQPPPVLPAMVPAGLRMVIGRCLEKDPARRYQRAGELRSALEALQDDPTARLTPRFEFAGRRWLIAGAAVLLIATAAAGWWMQRSSGANRRIQSLAVLPLENLSGNSGEDYFAAGMHEALITDLSRIGLQKVIAKPSADTFKGTKKTPREIGRELGVDGLITGSVTRSRDRVQVSAQLLDAETGAVVWANRYDRGAGDVLALQNDVVGAIARELRATLSPETTARLAAPHPVNAAAHDSHLKGRSMLAGYLNAAFDMKLMQEVIDQFDRAIELDPGYAPPYVARSYTYLTASQTSLLPPGETFPKARAAALKAVQLDDTLAEAHAILGEVALWYDWDWATADREIQRALQLNRDSADALRASESYLTLVAGKYDEAARTSQRILTLDPLNPFSRVQPVWVAFNSRRYDESIRHAKSLQEVWPNNIMAPLFLSANFAVKGMAAETHAECGKVMAALSGAYVMQMIGLCAWAEGTVGETAGARRFVEQLEHPPTGIWLDPAVMAQAYAALGDIDRAMTWAHRGLQERSPNMVYLKTAAQWDPVRGDDRFKSIYARMNFPP